MFNVLLEITLSIFSKIVLGGMLILSFLGISTTPESFVSMRDATTNTPISIEIEMKEAEVLPQQLSTPQQTLGEAEKQEKPAESMPPSPELTLTNNQVIDPTPLTPPEPPPLIPQEELNNLARTVVVNVFCLTKTTGVFEPITGSGVVISEKGVILTNAHVAQYLLLKDYKIPDFLNCVVRTGSPAIPLYKAELLYLPPVWITENALNIKLDKPTGTGENDFALLRITETTRMGATLPETFPAITFDSSNIDADLDDPVLLASYPAGFLGGFDITRNLWLSSTVTHIMKLYTFRDTPPYTEDAFSVGGSVVAQLGASGGGVFSLKSGKLIGLLATSLLEGNTDERDLRAISLSHINERIKTYTGEDLATFLSGNIKQKSAEFNSAVAPQLTQILTDILNQK